MERNQSYVLIVDGGNYCFTEEKVLNGRNGYVDANKVVAELERILNAKFTTKFFFQGTQSNKPNEFHRILAQPPPHGPHFNVEIFGKKKQSGFTAKGTTKSEIFVEEGVDVAVATKIIECAYGIGKEERSEKIVVITGDGDLLKAIECADAKRRNTVHVVSARKSLSASLQRYVLLDPVTGCAVYLDEVMSRCVRIRGQPTSSGAVSDSVSDSNDKQFETKPPPVFTQSTHDAADCLSTGYSNMTNNFVPPSPDLDEEYTQQTASSSHSFAYHNASSSSAYHSAYSQFPCQPSSAMPSTYQSSFNNRSSVQQPPFNRFSSYSVHSTKQELFTSQLPSAVPPTIPLSFSQANNIFRRSTSGYETSTQSPPCPYSTATNLHRSGFFTNSNYVFAIGTTHYTGASYKGGGSKKIRVRGRGEKSGGKRRNS